MEKIIKIETDIEVPADLTDEQIYDVFLEILAETVKYEDVFAFTFKEGEREL